MLNLRYLQHYNDRDNAIKGDAMKHNSWKINAKIASRIIDRFILLIEPMRPFILFPVQPSSESYAVLSYSSHVVPSPKCSWIGKRY